MSTMTKLADAAKAVKSYAEALKSKAITRKQGTTGSLTCTQAGEVAEQSTPAITRTRVGEVAKQSTPTTTTCTRTGEVIRKNTPIHAKAADVTEQAIQDQRATGRSNGTHVTRQSTQEPTGATMGIKTNMMTQEELRAMLYQVFDIKTPAPTPAPIHEPKEPTSPIQVNAICLTGKVYKHQLHIRSEWKNPHTGWAIKKPNQGKIDDHSIIPPEDQLMRSHECFHCHKRGHYARNCCTKKKIDCKEALMIKVISAPSTSPVMTSANCFSALEEENLNAISPAPVPAPKLLDAKRIKELIAANATKLDMQTWLRLIKLCKPQGIPVTTPCKPSTPPDINAITIGQAIDKLNNVFVNKSNSVQTSFPLSHYRGIDTELALLDSGATEFDLLTDRRAHV